MPQATDELRAEWGIETEKALYFLRAAGYRLTNSWTWVPPRRESTEMELRAIEYLIQEWDFGGIERWEVSDG